jgi:uncharacterized membrane protein
MLMAGNVLGAKTMDTRRIIAHIWMFILIMLGVVSAFLFIPSIILFSKTNRYYLSLVSIPFLAIALYNFISAFYYRLNLPADSRELKKLTEKKAFGRMVHPTCTTLAILAWGFFLYSPDLKIFMADIWISIVVFSWIRVEKYAYSERPEKPANDNTSGP